MIPIRLTLSGFLSYRDPVELDFTSFEVACIAGPNGSGKSSLLDAITWALFGQARRRDDSLINSHPEVKAAEVTLIFAYEGNRYRVQRTKPRRKTTLLEFHILQNRERSDTDLNSQLSTPGLWKPLTERTLRETQAYIESTLRLDYETFVNASFFLQGKADLFTQQRPGDRKRILGSILGLEIWDTYRQRSAERRKTVESDIAGLDGRLHEIEAELAEEETRKARLEELQDELERLSERRNTQESTLENIRKIAATLAEQRKLVDALARQIDSASGRLDQLETRVAARQKELDTHSQVLARTGEIETAYAAWKASRAEVERWDKIAAEFHEHEKRRQEPLDEINTARTRLEEQVKRLGERRAAVEASESQVSNLLSQLDAARGALTLAEEQLARRAGLSAELDSARQRQAEARAENPRLKSEMDELKERIDTLSETEGANCPLCGQPLSPAERLSLMEELGVLGKEMGDKYRANKTLLSQVDQGVGGLEAQIAALTKAEATLRTNTRTVDQISAQLEQIQARSADWEREGAVRLGEIQAALSSHSFAPGARARLAEIDAELKATGYDAAAHDAVRQAEVAGRASEAELRALERAKAAVAPVEREISDLKTQISAQQHEITRQQQEHDQAASALAAAEAQAPDLYAAERDLLDLQEQENRLRMKVGAAQQKVLVLDGLKDRRKALEAQKVEFALLVTQYKQLERAFGKDGVPALLIEQALPQIEAKANQILERLSGGSMSVRFVTQAAYKDKRREDLKETLEIQISDSAGRRDYELFSGGEAFRVNFAIRLALSEVLAKRAGARLQTLVIDEGFGSQDALGRQRLIESINMVRRDFAKILVITHIDELKDAFPTKIEVEKTPRGSTVRVI